MVATKQVQIVTGSGRVIATASASFVAFEDEYGKWDAQLTGISGDIEDTGGERWPVLREQGQVGSGQQVTLLLRYEVVDGNLQPSSASVRFGQHKLPVVAVIPGIRLSEARAL